MKRMLKIIKKDLVLFFSDKKVLLLTILMPIVLMSILGVALKGNFSQDAIYGATKVGIVFRYDKENEINKFITYLDTLDIDIQRKETIKMIVSNMDIEKLFFDGFFGNEEINRIIDFEVFSEEMAQDLFENNNISAVVYFEHDYMLSFLKTYFLADYSEANIEFLGIKDRSFSNSLILMLIGEYDNLITDVAINKNVIIDVATKFDVLEAIMPRIDEISNQISQNANLNANISYEDVNANKPLSSDIYYTFSIAAMFILFSAGIGGGLMLNERNDKTYHRQIVAGMSKVKLLLGKYVVIALSTFIQISAIYIFTGLIRGLDWGSILNVFIIALVSSASVAGLGSFIGAYTFYKNSDKLANAFTSIIAQIMALFGGSFIPLDVFPEAIRKFSDVTFNGLMLKMLLANYRGDSLSSFYNYMIFSVALGFLFFLLGLYFFKKEGNLVA